MIFILYECEICGGLHEWNFNGDCRDDANRYVSIEEFRTRQGIGKSVWVGLCEVEVRSMSERVAADFGVTVDELNEQGFPRT